MQGSSSESAAAAAFYPQWVLRSFLLGGMIATCHRLSAWLHHAWQSSILAAPFLWLARHSETKPAAWVQWVLLVAVLAVLALSLFASTEQIGFAMLGVAFLSVLLGALTGSLGWLRQLSGFDWLVLAYFACHALAASFSSWQGESVVGLSKALVFVAGYFSFRSVFYNNPLGQRVWLVLLFAAGLLEAVFCWLQVNSQVEQLATWSDVSINTELTITRVYGTLQPLNPNLLAGFLLPTFSAGLACLVFMLQRGLQLATRWPWLLLNGLGLCAIAWALAQTGSRGAYISLVLMAGAAMLVGSLLLWQWLGEQPRFQRWRNALVGVVPLGALLFVGAALLRSEKLRYRLSSIFSMREDSSISYRFNVYDSCWQMAIENWWSGIGPGNTVFKQVYGLYMQPGYNALGCYSVPLEVWVELGIAGLVVIGSLYTLLVGRLALLCSTQALTFPYRWLGLALIMGLLGFLGQGLFDTVWYRPAVQLIFWGWLALCIDWIQQAGRHRCLKPAPTA